MSRAQALDRDLSFFRKIPWCAKVLADPSLTLHTANSRVPKSSGEDTFFADTLATHLTIPSLVTLSRGAASGVPKQGQSFPAISEVILLIWLGDGLNGNPHMAHGGLVATILDEVMGILLSLNKDYEERRLESQRRPVPPRNLTLTANLTIDYRRPITTNSAVLARSRFESVKGKKTFVRGTIEDGDGNILTEGRALFVQKSSML